MTIEVIIVISYANNVVYFNFGSLSSLLLNQAYVLLRGEVVEGTAIKFWI